MMRVHWGLEVMVRNVIVVVAGVVAAVVIGAVEYEDLLLL